MLRDTNRATNTAWYTSALELDHQLHLRHDGTQLLSLFYTKKTGQWSAGPSLTEETFKDPAKAESFAAEILRIARSLGATSLGVLLHVADEFALAELKPELNNPAALPDLRDTAIINPAAILDDTSVPADQASWRVLPYPAAGGEPIGAAVTISRTHAAFLTTLREAGQQENFPLITHALSAPLVTMMGLPGMIRPTPGKCYVAIMQYPWFTVMAFFSDHHDLRLVRTLQHRGVRRATNFRQALTTTNASLEYLDPDLFLIPLGQGVDAALAADLRVTFATSRVESLTPPSDPAIPYWAAEPILAAQQELPESAPSSLTFTMLREEKWATQDFLPAPREVSEIFPTLAEMRLLRVLRLARVILFAVAILALAYLLFGVFDVIRKPEWGFKTEDASSARGRLTVFTAERQREQHWSNLLEDRSKAWATMELLARLFPPEAGMKIKTFNHAVRPDTAPGQAKVGFVKEWKITGLARDEALDRLNTINSREGINTYFSDVARSTGNEAFRTDIGNRSIVVNVRTLENNAFKVDSLSDLNTTDDSTYPYTFDLTITQRFESSDPLAVNAAKAP